MIIFTKEWVGSPLQKELETGADSLRDALVGKNPVFAIKSRSLSSPSLLENIPRTPGSITGNTIYQRAMRDIEIRLEHSSPEKIVLLGGGCAMDLPVIRYLKKTYPVLRVLWLDAHADLHTPATSRTHYIHGMALGLLLNRSVLCDEILVKPGDVLLVGTKELDEEESTFIDNNQMSLLANLDDLDKHLRKLESKTFWYVHVDFDAFNPGEIQCKKGTRCGDLRISEMRDLLALITQRHELVGISLLENTETRKKVLVKLADAIRDLIPLTERLV